MAQRRPFCQIIDGVPRPPNFNPDVFRESLKFRALKDDVVMSAYPKVGTHWLQYIVQLILKEGEPVDSHEEFTNNIRSIEHTANKEWKPVLPARFYYTHLPLRRETMNPKAKYIYAARNPWDTCVSFYHMISDLSPYRFQDGTFAEFFEAFLEGSFGFGSFFEHVAAGYALRNEPNVFFVTYEELKADTRGTVLRLAHFLGDRYGKALEDSTTGLLDKLLERSSSEYMKNVMVVNLEKKPAPGAVAAATGRKIVTSKAGHQGDETKYAVVRSAKVGGWKEYFTPDQLRRLEDKIRDMGERAAYMSLWDDIHKEAIAASSDK
ncbi:3-alpha-hydroxysteroid sulfotransferase-like [Amblyomma americanum]